jgi:predicted aconitase
MDAINRWHEVVASRDLKALGALLDEEAVFESPIVHRPQVGRASALKYLAGALVVLGNEDFHYVGEWRGETGAVLEFATRIDGIEVNGVDIIRWTEDRQRIANFKVMIRPMKAIDIVRERMAAMLAG